METECSLCCNVLYPKGSNGNKKGSSGYYMVGDDNFCSECWDSHSGSLEELRAHAKNGGFEGSVVVQKVMAGEGNFGFNADTGEYEDLIKAGVVDPTKVTRFALQNAASVSGLLMTTEAMVAEKPKKNKNAIREMPPEDMY